MPPGAASASTHGCVGMSLQCGMAPASSASFCTSRASALAGPRKRPFTAASHGPSLQVLGLSVSAPPTGSGGKRLFVTVVTVRESRRPYGRGDDQRVVREHEGREGHADEVEGEHLQYAADRERRAPAIAGDLG